jgi:hypothetical protein
MKLCKVFLAILAVVFLVGAGLATQVVLSKRRHA